MFRLRCWPQGEKISKAEERMTSPKKFNAQMVLAGDCFLLTLWITMEHKGGGSSLGRIQAIYTAGKEGGPVIRCSLGT